VRIAKRYITLSSSLSPIPSDICKLTCSIIEANSRLGAKRRELIAIREQRQVLLELEQAVKPRDVPSEVVVLDSVVARDRIKQLERLHFHPKPQKSATVIRLQLRLQEAEDELARCQKPERVIQQIEVDQYVSKLASLEVLTNQLEDAQAQLIKHTITREMLADVKREVSQLENRFEDDKKYSVMDKQAQAIELLCDELDQKQRMYDVACEYLEQHFKPSSNMKMSDHSRGLANDVNSFLIACESNIRVSIPMKDDRTKIICYKNGKKLGSPTEASDGELSLISFAFCLCFCIMRKSGNFIILDEVTREMSAHAKDKSIKIALDIAKKAGKTLLVTDHTCICGDYDKVIDLTK
jgi:hypothetical protein